MHYRHITKEAHLAASETSHVTTQFSWKL